jgi:MFS superfamily sulfate permease-like transporter
MHNWFDFGFDRKTFGADALASIVVFLVALPLCMGVAIASGVPPALGLITGVIGGLLVGLLAGSPLQVSGPAAGLTVLVFEIVHKQGIAVLGAILLAAGAIQMIAGLLKLGQWFRAVSPAVIHGMLAGIGVLIFAAQFHVMMDGEPAASGLKNLLSIPSAIYKGIFPLNGSVHHLAASIGLITILTMVMWSRFRPERLKLIPAPLVAIMISSGIAMFLALPIQYVNVPEQLADSVTLPTLETLSRLWETPILLDALALAFIASAETLLSAAAVDRIATNATKRTDYDRELCAQGIGNMACGFLGAIPMTGVIVRSSANVQAGARTRLSTMFHGVWLLLAVLSLPTVLRLIPTSALGAILVYTGYKLINKENIKALAKYGRIPLVIYFVTVAVIVAKDLLTGVLVGVVLSVLKLLYEVSHLEVRVVRGSWKRVDLHLEGSATFIGLPKIAAELDRLPHETELHVHAEKLSYIDHACLDLLAEWEKQNALNGSKLVVQWDHLIVRYNRSAKPKIAA